MNSEAVDGEIDPYTQEERELLSCYHALKTVYYLSVKRFLLTGDSRLATAVYHQVFLGIRPR